MAKQTVKISRNALSLLVAEAQAGREIREQLGRFLGVQRNTEDLPNGIDWSEIDVKNALEEAQRALQANG